MKKMVFALLDRLGISVKRKQYKWEHLNSTRVEQYALNGLIHSDIMDTGSMTIVQIGAFDGVSNNAVDYSKLGQQCHVNAVLVEPNPVAFEKLKSNFMDKKFVRLINAAVDITDGYRSFTVVAPHSSPKFHWIDQLSSFDRQTILSHCDTVPDLSSYMQDVTVECFTLSSLLRIHSIEHLDLLLVDTEGYDAIIIENALSDKVYPRIIVFEHTHLGNSAIQRIHKQLVFNGYSIVDIGQDFLCWIDR